MEAAFFLFVKATIILQFKAKNFEINPYSLQYLLFLENISKYSTSNNMIKTGLNKYVHDFSIDYNIN